MSAQSLSVHAGYYDLLVHAGLNPLASARFGKRRGDIIFAVEREGQYGIIVVGFGSCTACDILVSIRPPDGVEVWDEENLAFAEIYAAQLANTVIWGWRDNLRAYMTHPDYSLLRWYGHEPGYDQAISEILEHIPVSEKPTPPKDPRVPINFKWFDPRQDVTNPPAIEITVLLEPGDTRAREALRSELSQALFEMLKAIDGGMRNA